jgi:hypothetical protein
MKHTALIASLVLFSALLSGSVPNPHAVYVSGTAAIPNGTEGSLNLGDAGELRFNYDGGAFKLPYERITALEISDKPGVKSHMAGAFSWVPKFGKKQGRLLNIAFKGDSGNGEAAIFEIYKSEYQAIAPVLEARTGKHVKMEDESSEADNAKPAPVESAPSLTAMVPVTINSNPPGATVSFWGQIAGKTPVVTKLLPGTYTVQITGVGAWTGDITVEPGKPMSVSADFSQAGSATVASVR